MPAYTSRKYARHQTIAPQHSKLARNGVECAKLSYPPVHRYLLSGAPRWMLYACQWNGSEGFIDKAKQSEAHDPASVAFLRGTRSSLLVPGKSVLARKAL